MSRTFNPGPILRPNSRRRFDGTFHVAASLDRPRCGGSKVTPERLTDSVNRSSASGVRRSPSPGSSSRPSRHGDPRRDLHRAGARGSGRALARGGQDRRSRLARGVALDVVCRIRRTITLLSADAVDMPNALPARISADTRAVLNLADVPITPLLPFYVIRVRSRFARAPKFAGEKLLKSAAIARRPRSACRARRRRAESRSPS